MVGTLAVVYGLTNFIDTEELALVGGGNEVAMVINLALLFFLMRMVQLIAQLNPMFQELVHFLKKKGVRIDEIDERK